MSNSEAVEPITIFTIGHSTRTLDEFVHLLQSHNVRTLVDVRKIPRSRRNPQFNQEALPNDLRTSGIDYLHLKGLGGLRRPTADSLNTGWRNASFRGFSDHMQTTEFETNLQELLDIAKNRVTAIMCAEAVPWRCHRSLISDALVVREVRVAHIMSLKTALSHVMTKWARVDGRQVIYPPA